MSTKFAFIDKKCTFDDKFSYLIDMIILLIIVIALAAVALFLKGEGGSFGNGNNPSSQQKRFSTSDKNYFL
jgi:hypothetical protein